MVHHERKHKHCNRIYMENMRKTLKQMGGGDKDGVEAGLEFPHGHGGHCLPFFKFGYDALRPMSTFSVFFTTSWPWCLFVTLPMEPTGSMLCPMAWVPPVFKI